MSRKKLEVEQIKATSATPPADRGFYKKSRTAHGLVGDLYRRDPATGQESSFAHVTELTAAQLATYTGRTGETVEVTDLPGRPQYRWDGSAFAAVVTAQTDPLTGGVVLSAGASRVAVVARNPILSGASAGANSGWLPISSAPERFAYQLDSGSTATTFSIDISADGVNSLGQAFTGTWARSDLAEITPPIMFSNPLAKFFRWNVVSGGPFSVSRGV